MELRHIRYFLAVADEGTFTKAAAHLGIGQPPLSVQIRDLETEVGARLFHRLPHGVELTEAGRAFHAAVKSIPERAGEAIHVARRAARGQIGRLSLGFTGAAAINPVVPAVIRAYRRRYPDVELKLEEANSIALVAGLLEGRLDVAIIRPTASDPLELTIRPLVEEDLVVALPSAHPAARGDGGLALATLLDEPLILTPRALGVSLHDAALRACRAAGFEPVIGQPAPQIASILSLVAAESGVSLVPASMRQLAIEGVVYREIAPPTPRVGLAVALREHGASVLATNFARAVAAVVA